tara:strand:- start:172 stop:285 length:114 start_codon:yes stop_codon:yes gene_type:complete
VAVEHLRVAQVGPVVQVVAAAVEEHQVVLLEQQELMD